MIAAMATFGLELARGVRGVWLLALVVLLSSCTVSVPLDGKRCASTEPRCVTGYACVDEVCVRLDGGDAGPDAGCPSYADPAARDPECRTTVWYLAVDGGDSADGRTPSSPRRTLPPGVGPGDEVVLLAGEYLTPPSLELSGTVSCPILIRGDADGGTVIRGTLRVVGSFAVFRDLVFRVANAASVEVTGDSRQLVFQRDTFAPGLSTTGFSNAVDFVAPCADCTVRESVFQMPASGRVSIAHARGPNFVLRGNRIACDIGAGLWLAGPNALVEGNRFTGRYDAEFVRFLEDGGRFEFNEVELRAGYPDKVFITGETARVRRNTFTFSEASDAAVADVEVFEDNLVSGGIAAAVLREHSLGRFNLVDGAVAWWLFAEDGGAPDPSNLRGPIALVDGVPTASSLALDSADPSLPVPPGGGARADIGARERGAALLPDGRYCLLDAGR
ncbi:MAG: hypothetical protein ACOZQL_42910 [Myxococcota bacterium]